MTIVVVGFFLAFVVQAADHFERRTRYSRNAALIDTKLENKLDSIMSLLGKLNDKIDSQEQRIAVLSRQVSNIKCNGEQRQGNDTVHETHNCYIVALYFLPRQMEVYSISPSSLVYLRVDVYQLKAQTDPEVKNGFLSA